MADNPASRYLPMLRTANDSTRRCKALAVVPSKKLRYLEHGRSQVQRLPSGISAAAAPTFTYQQADSAAFSLRQKGYSRSKRKAPSQEAMYELAAVDLYSTTCKHFHIARRLRLPEVVNSSRAADGRSLDACNIPPLLVLHILMPTYPATFFATTDGPSVSYIYYFRLPCHFCPESFHTPEVRNRQSSLQQMILRAIIALAQGSRAMLLRAIR